MRLFIGDYGTEINIHTYKPTCFFIESQKAFRTIMVDIWMQSLGTEGSIKLSEDSGRTVSWDKDVILVANPFAVNCNEKRLLSGLYQDLSKLIIEDFYEESSKLNSIAIELLDSAICKYSYPVECDLDMDILSLLKMYKVRLPDTEEDVIGNLSNYCKMMRRICGKKAFIFVNLKQIMEPLELSAFYKDLLYEEIYLLDIESNYSYTVDGEKCIILDKDLCIIDIH